jgi:carboxyl-terminal processing protease
MKLSSSSISVKKPVPAVVSRFFLSLFLLVCIIGASAASGYFVGRHQGISASVPSSVLSAFNSNATKAQKVDFSVFWQAWNALDKNFYGTADQKKRLDGAISGMVASANDPYTFYLEPKANNLFRTDLQGSFGGIGAELTVKNNLVTVVSALQGTPADLAGIKAQDIVVAVNGTKTLGMNFNDIINTIRGPKGSEVELTLGRQGQDQPLKIKVTRDTITVKSVSSSAIGDNDSYSYIKVNQFGDDTVTLLQSALTDAKTSGKKGIVMDMRNNPGGYLDSSVTAIGMVIPDTINSSDPKLKARAAVLERFKDGTEQVHKAANQSIVGNIPMVVVVNGGSASAAEIFAGAMKDYGRAKVIGTKTFGKGSVQTLVDLDNGGSVKVTIAKWFTPLGVGIDGKGIDPDVIVPLGDKEVPTKSDAQIAKALELLK